MPKVSKKDPEKPKGAKSAYNFFLQHNKEEMKGEQPMALKDFSRHCAEKWKGLTDEEKKPFQEMAGQDKERYKKEMESYSPPPAVEIGGKKRKKQIKDPNQPKRNLNPYLFFLAEKRDEVKSTMTNPTAGAIVKVLGETWAKMADSEKEKYVEMAKKDKERYEEEMKVFKGQKELATNETED